MYPVLLLSKYIIFFFFFIFEEVCVYENLYTNELNNVYSYVFVFA